VYITYIHISSSSSMTDSLW